MKLSEISINRPVLAIVMSLILVVFGLLSMTFLSVREYPDIDPPVISVNTVYPGAAAEIIETTITEILEDEIIGIEGIKTMTSDSREGLSVIIIEFILSRNVDVAAQDVRDRVSRARGRLPRDIEEPIIAKQDTDASAIMWIGLGGERFSSLQLTDYADRHIIDHLQTVPGVGRVIVGGSREYAMRIWLDPEKMAARGITALEVRDALQRENVEIPSGRVEGPMREFTVRTRGELKTPEQFNRLIVKRLKGQAIYIEDIGHAEIGPRSDRSLVRFNAQPAVGLGIVKQSKANTLDVANGIKDKLEELRPNLPEGLNMEAAYDSSVFIQNAINDVVLTLWIAFALVVFVIFLFLGNLRAVLIPSITIPVSLVATFVLMYGLGYTINTITLLGMTLAIGLVVDDSIVVLENIFRRIESGETPMQAAHRGIGEIAFAVITTTVVLVAVFLPIIFMEGSVGRILKEFAVVISGAVVISSFVSLTLTPMLCSRLLKSKAEMLGEKTPREGGKLLALTDGFANRFKVVFSRYETSLGGIMNKKKLVLAGLVLLTLISAGVYGIIPKEFLPTEDRGTIMTFITAPEGSTLGYTQKAVVQAENVYASLPEVRRMFSVIALSAEGQGAVNSGVMFVNLKPKQERSRKQQQIIGSIFPQMMSIPEAFVFPLSPPSGPARGFGQPVQMVVQSTGDLQELSSVAERIAERAREEIPGLMNVDTDLKLDKPQIEIDINREKASALGVSIRDVGETLQILLGGLDLSSFQYNHKRYDVMVQALPGQRQTPSQLENIFVEGPREGLLIPLASVVDFTESVAPKELHHFNRLRAVTVSGAIAPIPGMSLGPVLAEMKKIATEEMPGHMSIAWKGESREFFDAGYATIFAFLLAMLLVYLVLSAQFESFLDPFVVMTTVPLAVCGAFLTLAALSLGPMLLFSVPGFEWLQYMNFSINIFSQIGLVLLIGLVTKNGILIVEFANQIRARQPELSTREAVIEAAKIRFRPILMTAISTIFGALPIFIGLGAGADGRRPLGAVVVGGMLLATFLTLFVVPMVYDALKRRKDERPGNAKSA